MPTLLQGAQTASELPGGYGAALLQALLALVGVCLLAWVLLRWLGRRGFGVPPSGGRVEVLERTPLDSSRSLFLVRVGERVWLVGAGDGAAPTLLAELDPQDLPAHQPVEGKSFADVWSRLSKGRSPR